MVLRYKSKARSMRRRYKRAGKRMFKKINRRLPISKQIKTTTYDGVFYAKIHRSDSILSAAPIGTLNNTNVIVSWATQGTTVTGQTYFMTD